MLNAHVWSDSQTLLIILIFVFFISIAYSLFIKGASHIGSAKAGILKMVQLDHRWSIWNFLWFTEGSTNPW